MCHLAQIILRLYVFWDIAKPQTYDDDVERYIFTGILMCINSLNATWQPTS